MARGIRPDLAFGTTYMNQFNNYPSTEHWAGVQHTLCYQKQSKNLNLTIKKTGKNLNVFLFQTGLMILLTDIHSVGMSEVCTGQIFQIQD